MTPLTKFQQGVKLLQESCEVPKVMVYAEVSDPEVSTSIWASEGVEPADYFWMQCWLDEQAAAHYSGSYWYQIKRWWRSRPRRSEF